jgi:hypothetical protein
MRGGSGGARHMTFSSSVSTLAMVTLAFVAMAFPATADARHCNSVRASGLAAVYIDAYSIGCYSARTKIRQWLNRGYFPRSQSGWYCLYGHRVNRNGYLCSGTRAIIAFDVWD